jgi:hypothetical protein
VDEDDVTHIGRIDFRNDKRPFGIKDEDRFSHVYVIGKTGTGKSTLIETMALQDLERGHGFALIDPHGDLVARIAAARPLSHHFRPAVRWRAAPISRTRINTLALGARLTVELPGHLPAYFTHRPPSPTANRL